MRDHATTEGREQLRRPAGTRSRSSDDGPLRMLALQRAVGNRAVTAMVQRSCSGGGCGCASCSGSAGETPAEVPDDAPQTVM